MQKVAEIFLNKDAPKQFLTYFKLVNAWKECLPVNIVANTTPVKLSSDLQLTVNVHDNSWLTELNYDKNTVLTLLNNSGFEVKDIIYKFKPLSIKRQSLKRERAVITDKIQYIIDDCVAEHKDTIFYEAYKSALTAYFQSHRFNDFRSKRS